MSSMTPLLVVDREGHELGRCSVERGHRFQGASSVDLGPVGYFTILDVRGSDPIVLVAEPADRDELPYELVVRSRGIEERRALLKECAWSVGERVQWPPQRGAAPAEHEVVAVRPAADAAGLSAADRRSVIVIERVP